jgi:hypothetical protein
MANIDLYDGQVYTFANQVGDPILLTSTGNDVSDSFDILASGTKIIGDLEIHSTRSFDNKYATLGYTGGSSRLVLYDTSAAAKVKISSKSDSYWYPSTTTSNFGFGVASTSSATVRINNTTSGGLSHILSLEDVITDSEVEGGEEYQKSFAVICPNTTHSRHQVMFASAGGEDIFDLRANGFLTTVNLSESSDIRIKSDIKTISSSLDSIKLLNPVTYYNEKSKMEDSGLIAQEVEPIIPHLVSTTEVEHKGEIIKDFKSLSYTGIIPYLIGSIKELSAKVDSLEKQLEAKK